MSKTMLCEIVSAQEAIFSGQATMVFAKGTLGELGIAPRHAPLITQLKPGPVRVQTADGEELFFFIGGGILEVQPHSVNVLADTAVRGDDLDASAAQRAMEEAERQLAERADGVDAGAAQAKLDEAMAQLQALEQLRGKLKR